MKDGFLSRTWAVMRRELRIWRQRPIYLAGSIAVMAFMAVFFLTFMGEGYPSDMPVGVVDSDHSSISRMLSDQLDATQTSRVVHYDSWSEAREDLQAGRIFGVMVIPEGMMDDVESFRQPKVSFYVNGLYYVGGALSYKQLQEMTNLASGAVRRETMRLKGVAESEIMGKIEPVYFDLHYIGSPGANIGRYLCNMLLPGILEVVMMIIFIYSLGTELKYGTSRHLLRVGGNVYTAVCGKMAVYTILFTLIGWTLQVVMYKWLGFPLAGSLGEMMFIMFLFVTACMSVSVFIVGTVPVLRLSICIGALYSILGISMCGFTLPVEMMPAGIRGLAYMYPLTFYYRAYVQAGIFNSGFGGWYLCAAALLAFQALPFLVMKRLGNAYEKLDYPRN